MLNNIAIDVVIGLIFILLIYSLLATIIQEVIARWLGLRSRMLLKGLRRMLEDEQEASKIAIAFPFLKSFFLKTLFGGWILICILNIKRIFYPFRSKGLLLKFYQNPSIKYLGGNNWSGKPSYLKSSNFSKALVHILRGNDFDGNVNQSDLIKNNLSANSQNIDSETLSYLKNILADANYDLDKFTEGLETWFDDTMERVAGWYKRQTQFILFVIGLCLAYGFNVDSIEISKILAKDKDAREQLVAMAISKSPEYEQIIDTEVPVAKESTQILPSEDSISLKTYKFLLKDIEEAKSILGVEKRNAQLVSPKEFFRNLFQISEWPLFYAPTRITWIGYLLTAIAISLGAPFWFDLLNRFMQIRGTGKQPIKLKGGQEKDQLPLTKRVG